MRLRALAAGCAVFAMTVVAAGPLAAEERSAAAPASPYAGIETRPIKALSAERIEGLRSGAGLGYALAAELNGHPGPKHVLELAEALELTEEQRQAVGASFERMRSEAIRLGEAIVAAEERLDRRFAHRHLDETTLAELTAEIARLEGRLRFTHLRAHLETDAVLSVEQRSRYAELRGYGTGGEEDHEHHQH